VKEKHLLQEFTIQLHCANQEQLQEWW
jgi:hypothetical protein